MKRTSKLLRTFGILTFLAVASLALPLSSHAGGVHVSIGLGLPFPVVVAPQPVVVHPAPVIVAQPPVMVAGPHVVYIRAPTMGAIDTGGTIDTVGGIDTGGTIDTRGT